MAKAFIYKLQNYYIKILKYNIFIIIFKLFVNKIGER